MNWREINLSILTYKYLIYVSLLFLFACSTKKEKEKTLFDTASKPIDSIADAGIGVADMRFSTNSPTVKDCFLAISEQYLSIPAKFRRTMVNNYAHRDVIVQQQQLKGDEKPEKYEYETDHIDEKRGYMMFSVFNDNKEANYFLRYFVDSSENGHHAIGLSRIISQKDQKRGSFVFLLQDKKTILYSDSLFPQITLRNFVTEKKIASLGLTAEQIEHPPLLVWMPQKNNKIGIDLNLAAFEEKKEMVKAACQRSHLDVLFEKGAFYFPEVKKPILIKKKTRKYRR